MWLDLTHLSQLPASKFANAWFCPMLWNLKSSVLCDVRPTQLFNAAFLFISHIFRFSGSPAWPTTMHEAWKPKQLLHNQGIVFVCKIGCPPPLDMGWFICAICLAASNKHQQCLWLVMCLLAPRKLISWRCALCELELSFHACVFFTCVDQASLRELLLIFFLSHTLCL